MLWKVNEMSASKKKKMLQVCSNTLMKFYWIKNNLILLRMELDWNEYQYTWTLIQQNEIERKINEEF